MSRPPTYYQGDRPDYRANNRPDVHPQPTIRHQAVENRIFDRMRSKYGDELLEQKLQRLDSVRKFYRRYPYDAWSRKVGLDDIDLPHPSNPHNELIAKETREELYSVLTDREREVAQYSEQGYKPLEIAEMRGKQSSGADRWIKHNVRKKFAAQLFAAQLFAVKMSEDSIAQVGGSWDDGELIADPAAE